VAGASGELICLTGSLDCVGNSGEGIRTRATSGTEYGVRTILIFDGSGGTPKKPRCFGGGGEPQLLWRGYVCE
jgi:hypothetical protein